MVHNAGHSAVLKTNVQHNSPNFPTKDRYHTKLPKELPVVCLYMLGTNNTHRGSDCKCLYNWHILHDSHEGYI